MSDFNETADFVVAEEILHRSDNFTLEDILNSVKEKIKTFFKTLDEMKGFIEERIITFCKVGLVSNTGFFYYVN